MIHGRDVGSWQGVGSSLALIGLARRITAACVNRADRLVARLWVLLPLAFFGPLHKGSGQQLVVSITTYPPRIGRVHRTLRSILMQSVQVDAIVLVLSCKEFPGGLDSLPKTLRSLAQVSVGRLVIHFTPDNQRSFKKLLPVLELYPVATVITADDDVIYWRTWAAKLLAASRRNPGTIVGTRGSHIKVEGTTAQPYSEWAQNIPNVAGRNVFLTGRGGILYPPNSLDARVLNWSVAASLCPSADDIWFKVMGTLADTASLQIDAGREYPSSGASESVGLWRQNQTLNENDRAFKRVIDYFNLWGTYEKSS